MGDRGTSFSGPSSPRRSSTPPGNRSSPLSYRTTVIENLNAWIHEFSMSPMSFLQNLTSPFRKKYNSPPSEPPSPVAVRRSKSEIYSTMIGDNESDSDSVFERPLANFLNGSPKTAKAKELIELSRFGAVEVENLEKGIGHKFQVSSFTSG